MRRGRTEQPEQPEAAPRIVAVKLEPVEECEGLYRVPPEPKHGGPGEIPPGFIETYHPQHGRLMTFERPPIAPEPPAGNPVIVEESADAAGE